MRSQVADCARSLIVFIVECGGKDLDKTLARHGSRFIVGGRLFVSRLDFCHTVRMRQLFEALTLIPGVTNAGHRVHFLVLHCLLEKLWMALLEANPLGLSLEETEVATGPCSPLVIARQTDASVLQDSEHVSLADSVFFKWVHRRDVRL